MKKILIKLISFNGEPAVELSDGDIFYQSQTISALLMHLDILGLDNIIVEFQTGAGSR